MTSLLLRGNAYGLKIGNEAGTPKMIEWLNPDLVDWSDLNGWTYRGQPIAAERLLHIPALVVPGKRLGVSPLQACAATVSIGTEGQRFQRDWFRNKAVPGMVFQNTERTLDAEVAARAKERLMGTLRSGEPFVTGKDWKLDVLKLSADEAGFVKSAKLSATQIANIYGVPPEEVGGETGSAMTYQTTEQQQIRLITNTLRPWIVRLEQAFSTLLPEPRYVRFNTDALIRVDTKTRYEVHRIARTIGLNSINEIRALEDLPPIPGGDDYEPLNLNPDTSPDDNKPDEPPATEPAPDDQGGTKA